MGLLIIIPFGTVLAWAIWRIFGWLRHGNFGREWWKAFTILTLVGLVLGVFFTFFAEYKVADKRMAGFPIPVAISSLVDGKWVAYEVPLLIRIPARATDLLFGVALCLAPIALAAFIKENKGSKDFNFTPRPPNPPA